MPSHSLTDRSLTTDLPAAPDAAREARRFVAEALGRLGCRHLTDVATLLTSELVTNAVVHAGSTVNLAVTQTANGVRVDVADRDPQPPEPAVRGLLAGSGRGLKLVAGLARHWGVDTTRHVKSVWFELAR